MYYEINVAKMDTSNGNGQYRHYFATAPRSIDTKDKLKDVYADLEKAFPEPMYKLNVTKWESKGTGIDMSKL